MIVNFFQPIYQHILPLIGILILLTFRLFFFLDCYTLYIKINKNDKYDDILFFKTIFILKYVFAPEHFNG